MDLETLYDVWERYKGLLRRCPHHGLPLWLQVQTFYNGVNPSTRQMIDAAAGGTINNKTPKAAYEFIEEMSVNNYQWQVMRTKPTKEAGVYNVDSVPMLSNQVHLVMQCNASGGGMNNPEYPTYGYNMETEQLNYMGNNSRSQNNPYNNTYNAACESSYAKEWEVLAEFEKKPPQKAEGSEGEEVKPKNNDKPVPKEYKPPVPYPKKLKKDRKDAQFSKSLELFKQLHINLPFVEAIWQMLAYAKFLKELLTNKRKFEDLSMVELNEECSAILQNKLPTKLKDPGSFTIPCLIGSLNVEKALADLGASINLMPYKMFKQLGLGEPKPTRISIQLADRSVKYPTGIIEDILVKVDKFIFPVDFVVLDMDEDVEVPLILGHLFLATARAVIDVGDGKLMLRVGDEEIIFKIYDAMRFSREQDDSCYFIDSTDHAT
ncbi:hypothetical protein CXB51_010262 [Gossypium anomalum]|uniref:Retrotransposon gag domain-containing protein n=1 Tax=Gossypium anomalum TaxID=47600 RepID=A0A8J6D1W8_9ROSI|nr:hypothetical protein CXB51_010262 [Gossypium anomalum]